MNTSLLQASATSGIAVSWPSLDMEGHRKGLDKVLFIIDAKTTLIDIVVDKFLVRTAGF